MKRPFLFALLGLYAFAVTVIAGWLGVNYGGLVAWCFAGFMLGLLNVFCGKTPETDKRQ